MILVLRTLRACPRTQHAYAAGRALDPSKAWHAPEDAVRRSFIGPGKGLCIMEGDMGPAGISGHVAAVASGMCLVLVLCAACESLCIAC